MFEDATFHSRGILVNQTPKWMLLTLTINLTGLTALIVLPLINPEGLAPQFLHRILYTPSPEPKVVAQRVVIQPVTQSAQAPTNSSLIIRIARPIISIDSEAQPSAKAIDLSSDLSSLPGDVPGATNLSTRLFQSATPPTAVKLATPRAIPISGGVSEGLIISKTNPTYPAIARATRTAGMVVLAATISTAGRIENLQVVSGPPMLRQAAIDAVETWRYRPYLLNNQPVEVETTINVVFTLGSQ